MFGWRFFVILVSMLFERVVVLSFCQKYLDDDVEEVWIEKKNSLNLEPELYRVLVITRDKLLALLLWWYNWHVVFVCCLSCQEVNVNEVFKTWTEKTSKTFWKNLKIKKHSFLIMEQFQNRRFIIYIETNKRTNDFIQISSTKRNFIKLYVYIL